MQPGNRQDSTFSSNLQSGQLEATVEPTPERHVIFFTEMESTQGTDLTNTFKKKYVTT